MVCAVSIFSKSMVHWIYSRSETGRDLLKILPLGEGVDGPLEALRSTNEELVYRPDAPIRVTNEIAYAD